MKILPILLVFFSLYVSAQPDTDVFLVDMERGDSLFQVSNFRNISENKGYDNQPYFMDDNRLLYAGTQNGQTEIMLYYISEKTQHRINAPTAGGEYSPKVMPGGEYVTAVRLDTTGLQRLYKYDFSHPDHGDYQMLLSELEIAYYAFYDKDWVVASILAGNQLDLVIANIPRDEAGIYVENAGRSIHKVPGSKNVSYTVINEEKNHDIYLVDVAEAEETYFVCQLPIGIQDYAWIDATTLILGSGSKLYVYDMFGPGEWTEMADLSQQNITNITRIAVSPNGKYISFAAERKTKTPSQIVDVHIAPFNNGDLENFANAFSEDVVVSRFPADTMYVGRKKLKENYARFYKNNKSWNVEVKDRIVIGNYVIDEEIATVNGKPNRQMTIYETKDGLIQSMAFISNKKAEDPLPPVLAQMKSYNERDIEEFLKAYTEDIKTYTYPNQLRSKGKTEMSNGYTQFFENTPDLSYTVPTRMTIGNIVIDEEVITANGNEFHAVAIYEINKGKITKVFFLQ